MVEALAGVDAKKTTEDKGAAECSGGIPLSWVKPASVVKVGYACTRGMKSDMVKS